MRLTAGKIYFWGAFSIAFLTVWNRFSTRNLRTIVDGIKEEKMREAEQLRAGQDRPGDEKVELTFAQRQKEMMGRGAPSFFNPYYEQQQRENPAMKGAQQ